MSDQTGDSFPKGIQLTPFDPKFRDQPYEVLKSLRDRAPVLHDDQFNRWYLTRWDDVRQILRDKDMSADPRKANTYEMIQIARHLTDAEMNAAAEYFSAIKRREWVKVVEAEMVPKARPGTKTGSGCDVLASTVWPIRVRL